MEKIFFIMGLAELVKALINEYRRLTRIMGLIMGTVIFQKDSQPVAPSICADSYTDGEMACSPARKITICTPDCWIIVDMLLSSASRTLLTRGGDVQLNQVFR